jgi:hypothetical protein
MFHVGYSDHQNLILYESIQVAVQSAFTHTHTVIHACWFLCAVAIQGQL